MIEPRSEDAFTIAHHGEVTVITASPALELLDISLADNAADLMLGPLRDQESPLVVVDLSLLPYFGSLFLSLLLRCHKLVSTRGGMMVLAGLSPKAKELLQITKLNLVWPIYDTRQEAIESLLSE
jgi:anti-anti-sigma factor